MRQFPPPNSVKINVSMFSKEHQFGTSAVVRDSKGIFLYAYGSVGHASALGATMVFNFWVYFPLLGSRF
ncbi:unnamed protein product [Cuscuta campestris]|uniref:Uncharacterized protein n=1 Tax=Cuscuta campestris TaxID=132261 RepID=A0A484NG30_9ASTE|nr:unnamed protein product [Cuscuta campestris]